MDRMIRNGALLHIAVLLITITSIRYLLPKDL